MQPILPSWFKQRQCKAEAVGTETYRLTGPNLAEFFIAIRKNDNGLWSAALRRTADGPELAATDASFNTPGEAWEAAFELYRLHVIV
jgi:hypothetical protein